VKPLLVIGLGNALMGDDSVGTRIAGMLAADPAVTARADVLAGGTDLLRYMDDINGRRRVVLIDALQSEGEPGEITVTDDLKAESGPESAHTLSAVRALEVMRSVMTSLEDTRFTWVLVNVREAKMAAEMTPAVEAAVGRVAEIIRRMK
jgi:hydrogenase maturation protease